MKYFLILVSLLCGTLSIWAQPQTQHDASELLQCLQKLNTVGAVLYVAAHPDDENTRLLAYLANERKLRTAYLSLTRGDGGQNLIGKEQGEALGLIRTQELLAARRTDGAEQFFTRANDFGFSKTPEETFTFWNKDSVLADVVWTIRKFKPDVIICRFPTTGEGGHGHHTASAILAGEAFEAAADPTRFPEQLKYVQVWQAKRLFWNTFNFGGTNTTAEDQIKIDVGVFNPLLGQYYGEIAAESRSMHKSQGFGSAKSRGTAIEYFKQLKGDTAHKDLFDGIDMTWNRFKETHKLGKLLVEALHKYKAEAPQKSVPLLAEVYQQLQSLKTSQPELRYWQDQKLKEGQHLLLACAGFWAEAYASQFSGTPGGSMDMTAQILSENQTLIQLNSLSFWGTDTMTNLSLKTNELYSFKHKATIPASVSNTNPYWLSLPHAQGFYTVTDATLIGIPENPAPCTIRFDITLAGLHFKIDRPLVYKYTDPVKGEIYRPFEILPPATVNIPEKVFVFTDAKPKTIQILVKAQMAKVSGNIQLKAANGWNITISTPQFNLLNKGDEQLIEAILSPPSTHGSASLEASILVDGKSYNKAIQRIEYDHIPYQLILSNAEAKLVRLELQKAGTHIGYIAGAGDEIPSCLQQVGYTITTLDDEMLNHGNLQAFDAIVTGIRAYNTNERLQVYYNKLMDYVKNGGNLLVQYNTNSRVGPVIAKIGPYPFTISRNRVTDEHANVQFLNENHTALNFPNKITAMDFEGWVQERGIYFATELDKHYETLLSMKDPNEKESDGSLILTKYGKGNFVYTGLAFFRELPAGVPGAYRLLANLLSLPKNVEP